MKFQPQDKHEELMHTQYFWMVQSMFIADKLQELFLIFYIYE